jgi:CHAT domain-containing protein
LGGAAAAPFSPEKAYRDARAAVDRGDLLAAAEKTEAALLRAGEAEDQWVWALRMLKGELLAKRGKRPEARALLEPELPAQFRTSEAAVWRLIGLGIAAEETQQLPFFDEALELATARQPSLLFAVHLARANVSKDFEKDLQTALALARHDGNRLRIAVVKSTMLYLYVRAAHYADAIEAGNAALRTFEALGLSGRAANAVGNLGWAYQELGDWERARELFTNAEANAARAGNPGGRLIWENQLGNVNAAQRRYTEAEQMYRRALQHARELSAPQTAIILTNLARLALDTGRLGDAQRLAAEALAAKPKPRLREELSARIVDARVAMLTGDHARAEKTLRDVIAHAEETSAKWTAEGALAQLYARMRRNELAEAAYKRSLETARKARTSIKDFELALSFFNTTSDVFNSYVDFLVRNERYEDALAVTETIRAQTLEEGLGPAASSRKADARTIARQEGATILSYWLGRDSSHLWIVTAGGVTYKKLPPESAVGRDAVAYRRDLLSRNGTLARSGLRGQQLYGTLIPAGIGKGARVIVVADGVLHALNFETLVVPSPQPHYWIEDVVISSASSVQLLAHEEAKKNTAASMLLVGDPAPADPAFPKLQFAAKEIASVGRHFDRPVVLAGAKATPAAYHASSPKRFAFVHFVAHGVSSRKHPLDSAVILGRDAARQYKLYARDIEPLDARLVTISSCYGAGERTFAGEGLVGLAWAFLRAGASQVIAALWEVNDGATPKLMDLMYAGIRNGRDPAVALRDAKLALVRGKDIYKMPRFWAPFVLYSGSSPRRD